MSPSPTLEIAKFVVHTTYQGIPKETIDNPIGMRAHILNALGVGLLGSTRWHGQKQLLELVKSWGGPGEATVWGHRLKLPAISAAMANCIAVNALEYDDGAGHAGGPVVSTALAVAEREGGVDGKEFIAAVTLGYEVISRMLAAARGGMAALERGVYTPGTFNVWGAMTAAGKLLGLNVDQMVQCFGIGGCEAFGLYTNSMTKRLHHSRSARTAIMAADLAKKGFQGSPDILEAEHGGFFKVIFPPELYGKYDLSPLTNDLGKDFVGTYTFIKMRASAGGDGVLDCLEEMMEKHSIKIDRIEKITLEMSPVGLHIHGGEAWRNMDPALTLTEINAALMHEGYKIVCMLMDGEMTQRQYKDERMKDPKTLELIRKFTSTHLTDAHVREGLTTALTIEYQDGTCYTTTCPPVKHYGHKERPPQREAIYKKFRECSTEVKGIDMNRANRIIEAVERLEELRDVSELAHLLIPGME